MSQIVERDSGTTLVSSMIMGRYILTQFVGDSVALAFIFDDPKNQRLRDDPDCSVVRLSCDHHLGLIRETRRIESEGTGKILKGAMGEWRLVPSKLTYSAARGLGLSINMSRSLGHCVLANCALSPEPEFTMIDLLPFLKLNLKGDR